MEDQVKEENNRRRVHIALVGGQPMPVYVGIRYTNPDEVILIHSKESKAEADRIAGLIKTAPVVFKEFAPVDMQKIIADAKALVEELDGESELFVDVTSGTKPWTIVMFQSFVNHENANIIYIGQNNGIYDVATGIRKQFNSIVNMDDVFALYNTRATDYISFSDVTQDDIKAVDELMKMRIVNIRAFNELTMFKDNIRRIGQDAWQDGSSISWNKDEGWIKLELTRRGKYPIYKKFSSPHIFRILFNAGWFEFDVANRLSKWIIASDIRIGVKFPYNKGQTKNEIDIILNLGNRLLFVECKTQIYDITDLDKFSKAVRNFGGLGSKMLFVTLDRMKDTAVQKCNDNDIFALSYAEANLNKTEVEKRMRTLLNEKITLINRK